MYFSVASLDRHPCDGYNFEVCERINKYTPRSVMGAFTSPYYDLS